MPRVWVFLGLLGVTLVGFARIVSAIRTLECDRQEVDAFGELFSRYVQGNGHDLQAYGEMIERSYRIQELLGPAGVMDTYIAPFRTHLVRNYNIILNALPAMRRDHERGSTRSDYQPMIGEALVRYMGLSADRIRERRRELRNPLVWFREGVGVILVSPLLLLQSLGVGSASGTARIAGSVLFRVLTGAVALASLMASVVTIVLGWDQTVRSLLGWMVP